MVDLQTVFIITNGLRQTPLSFHYIQSLDTLKEAEHVLR